MNYMDKDAKSDEFYKPHLRRIKRSHRKSRSGCVPCKRRRVKCGEERPACDNCRFRDIECSYSESATPKSSASNEGHAKRTKGPQSKDRMREVGSPDMPISVAGVHETELSQHYFQHTMHTFCRTSRRKELSTIWQVIIPSLAYSSSTVRRGMLTLGAMSLHFHQTRSDSSKHTLEYLVTAETHGEIFVQESRESLQELHSPSINSALATSKFLAVLGFAFYRNHRGNGVRLTDEAGWRWLHLLRGVLPLYKAATATFSTHVDPIIMLDMTPEISPRENFEPLELSEEFDRSHPLFFFIGDSLEERFDSLRAGLNQNRMVLHKQQHSEILHAIDVLHEVTEHVCTGDVHNLYRAMCSWPGSVTKGFVDILTECVPMALAVYAHWLVLVILIEDLWWIDDMGRAGIREVTELCRDESQSVQLLLEWPRRALEFERCQSHDS